MTAADATVADRHRRRRRASGWPSPSAWRPTGIAVAIFDRDADAADGGRRQDRRRRRHRRWASPSTSPSATRSTPASEQVRGRLGRADGAGEQRRRRGFDPFLKITLEKWNRLLAVNLTGTFQCCQAVRARHDRGGWGRIVNISSSSAQGGQPLMTHYVASKAGMIGFTKALALELGPHGHHRQHDPARVHRHADAAGVRGQGPARRGRRAPRRSRRRCAGPAGPRTSPPPARSSCRDEASYITGQVIGVNGGRNTGERRRGSRRSRPASGRRRCSDALAALRPAGPAPPVPDAATPTGRRA